MKAVSVSAGGVCRCIAIRTVNQKYLKGTLKPRAVSYPHRNTDITVPSAGGFFFPHRRKLEVFKENYSPDLLRKITYAGAHCTSSFESAHENLKTLAEVDISTSHIQRLTVRIAKEFDSRDCELSSDWDKDTAAPAPAIPIEVASISVDGGRTQIRQALQGPGVHNPSWTETKVGCLQVLQSHETPQDPHPQLPKIFQDKKSMKQMVVKLKGHAHNGVQEDSPPSQEETFNSKNAGADIHQEKDSYIPKILTKFVVADIIEAESFGHDLYHKAHLHHLHTARRKAFLGDGDRKIWSIYEDNFRAEGWIPILDFVHAVEYAFEAAKLCTDTEALCWATYMDFVTHIWQGKVLTVIRRLDKNIERMQNCSDCTSEKLKDTIEKLIDIRSYFKNNAQRMNYTLYRKMGLPISSCHVESLIKQFNIRIKSSEKFWNAASVKGIVKLKASILSSDNSYQQFWNERYHRQAVSKMIYKNSKSAGLRMAA